MSYTLSSEGGCLSLSADAWPALLAKAKEYGWEPMGTVPSIPCYWAEALASGQPFDPDAVFWPGFYVANSHQIVEGDDAKNLAAALERFLEEHPTDDDIADVEWDAGVSQGDAGAEELAERLGVDRESITRAPLFLDYETVTALVRLAKAGPFMIE